MKKHLSACLARLLVFAAMTTAVTTTLLASVSPASADIVLPTPGTKLAENQTLNIIFAGYPATFDPNQFEDLVSASAQQPVFETLVRERFDGKIVGAAAESWETSPDGKTWTFHLRKNARWSDGKPVTAHDFVYSWRRLTDPKTASPNGDFLKNGSVLNALAVYEGKKAPSELGVSAKDDYTFVVQLSKPVPWFNEFAQYWALAPVRQDIVEKFGDKWTSVDNIVTNGPYILKAARLNDYITYERNPYYWDKNVVITKITANFSTDANAVFYRYINGEVLTSPVPAQQKKAVQAERINELRTATRSTTWWLEYNHERPELQDVRVRKALTLLTDNEFIVKNILSAGIPSSILVPKVLREADLQKEAAYWSQDYKDRIVQANELLKQAGYSKSNPLKLQLLASTSKTNNKLFVAIQQQWQKGTNGAVELTYKPEEFRSYVKTSASKGYQVRIAGWRAQYNHASAIYGNFGCKVSTNYSGYCDPEYDGLLAKAENTQDAQERMQIYAQLNKLIQDKAIVTPMWWASTYSLVSPKLGGYSDSELHYYQDMYIIDK